MSPTPEEMPVASVAPAKPQKYEFFKVVQGYLEEAAKVAQIPEYITTILSQPKNEIIVNFPVRMDDGSVRLFKGYRIQHSNLLGPFKGGLRYHQTVSLDDLKALAAMMTWKCALMNLPLLENSDDFVFDNQMLAQCIYFGYRIGEVSCPTKYFEEASSINFRRSVTYGLGVLATTMQFALQRWGWASFQIFSAQGRKLEAAAVTYYARGAGDKQTA